MLKEVNTTSDQSYDLKRQEKGYSKFESLLFSQSHDLSKKRTNPPGYDYASFGI